MKIILKSLWQETLLTGLADPNLTRATVLDANGNAAGQATLVKDGKSARLVFPDSAMYVVLE